MATAIETQLIALLALQMFNAQFSVAIASGRPMAWKYDDTDLAVSLTTDHEKLALIVTNGERKLPTLLLQNTADIDEVMALLAGEKLYADKTQQDAMAREALKGIELFKLITETALVLGYKKYANHNFGTIYQKRYDAGDTEVDLHLMAQVLPDNRLAFIPVEPNGTKRDGRDTYTSDQSHASIAAALVANNRDNLAEAMPNVEN